LLTPTPHGNRHTKKLPQLAADPTMDLWAGDEAHFPQ
jgi:hypothetical protein